MAASFSEEDLARYWQITLRLYSDLHHSPQPRFHTELGLLKLVHARRLAPLEEVLAKLESGSPPADGGPPSGRPRTGPTPFERDQARRKAGAGEPFDSAQGRQGSGVGEPALSVSKGQGPGANPSDEFRAKLIARVEALPRKMLAVSLEKAVRWELTEEAVCVAFQGRVHLPAPEDQRLLAQISAELLGRPIAFRATTIAEDAPAGFPASSPQPPTPNPQLPEHPELAEFLRLFPGTIVNSSLEEKRERGGKDRKP